MKKILLLISVFTGLMACEKGEDFREQFFPGFSGSGEDAIWVVNSHTPTDVPFLTSVLPTLTPPTTYAKYDSTLKASYRKEVTPFSYRIYRNGEIAIIGKNAQNQNIWIKQPNLKWELAGSQINIFRNSGAAWDLVSTGFKDQDKLLMKFSKAFYGDNSSTKAKNVLEVYYVIF